MCKSKVPKSVQGGLCWKRFTSSNRQDRLKYDDDNESTIPNPESYKTNVVYKYYFKYPVVGLLPRITVSEKLLFWLKSFIKLIF